MVRSYRSAGGPGSPLLLSTTGLSPKDRGSKPFLRWPSVMLAGPIASQKCLRDWLRRMAGEPGSRLTAVLGMSCSPDTLLRLLRRLPDDPVEPPRVVSLDDWVWRRGHRYGTLICDLERHRRLDVLPDRDAISVSAWLKRYPTI